MLTLDACRCSSVSGELWSGGDLRWTAVAVPERTKTKSTIPGLRARFLPPEERGRQGGAYGGFSLSRGDSSRR